VKSRAADTTSRSSLSPFRTQAGQRSARTGRRMRGGRSRRRSSCDRRNTLAVTTCCSRRSVLRWDGGRVQFVKDIRAKCWVVKRAQCATTRCQGRRAERRARECVSFSLCVSLSSNSREYERITESLAGMQRLCTVGGCCLERKKVVVSCMCVCVLFCLAYRSSSHSFVGFMYIFWLPTGPKFSLRALLEQCLRACLLSLEENNGEGRNKRGTFEIN